MSAKKYILFREINKHLAYYPCKQRSMIDFGETKVTYDEPQVLRCLEYYMEDRQVIGVKNILTDVSTVSSGNTTLFSFWSSRKASWRRGHLS